jgi:hypothetical protein
MISNNLTEVFLHFHRQDQLNFKIIPKEGFCLS